MNETILRVRKRTEASRNGSVMRLTLVSLLCAGCSLVNSTDDLRNMDAGVSVDTGNVDGAPADGRVPDVFDSGPDVFDSGPPVFTSECFPEGTVPRLEVREATHPPQLAIVFPTRSTCAMLTSITVTEPGGETEYFVGVDNDELESEPFYYSGPRIPLIDEDLRVRTFLVNGFPVDLVMPVESLQVGQLVPGSDFEVVFTTSISMSGPPHLDIANDGRVIFDSNNGPNLGSWTEGPMGGNIFVWRTESDELGEDNVTIANLERYPADMMPAMAWFGFPVISDNGESFAFLDRTPGARRLMYRNGAGQPVELSLGLPPADHMDIREFSEGAVLLVSSQVASTLQHEIFPLATPGEPLDVMGTSTGFGLLFDGGYSASLPDAATSSRPTAITTDGDAVTGTDECESMGLVHYAPGSSSFTYRCGNMLHVGDNSFDPMTGTEVDAGWRILGVDNDQERVLLRNEAGGSGEPYFLVEVEEGAGSFNVVPVNLNWEGEVVDDSEYIVSPTLHGAALSPEGDWITYSLVTTEGEAEIYRIPVDDEI